MTQNSNPEYENILGKDTPVETPQGDESSPSPTPSSGTESEPSAPKEEKKPTAQVDNDEARRAAIEEAKQKDRLARERFHENEKLKQKIAELEAKQRETEPIDNDLINQAIEKKFGELNAKQQAAEIDKTETDFLVKHGITPGSELFKHLREKVANYNPKSPAEMQEFLRLHYRDATYEQPALGVSAPSIGGRTPAPRHKDEDASAMRYAADFGLTAEDYKKYGKK